MTTFTYDDLQRYLRQQREMYGQVLYVDPQEEGLPLAEPHRADDVVTMDHPEEEPRPPSTLNKEWQAADTLDALHENIHTCTKCELGFSRKSFVFGSGNPNADLMIVGEAPGADEDEQGLPFVGRAGQLLTKILEAIHFRRDEVYICNILKCRPPNNRKPLATETDECEPYLHKQIALVRPRYILALGLTAANTLLKNKESMSALRGKTHSYQDIPLLVTYHPAALLRNPEWKKLAWEDVQLLRRLYDSKV
ncbi:MAG: uracil-DNA glycosylase [Candidatus Kapabacteria bacterium]|nr:uracil-DNA glycosylase [Candidatus Kapabacteria bacterium]